MIGAPEYARRREALLSALDADAWIAYGDDRQFAGADHVRYLTASDITLIPSSPWKSPASGAVYPQQWQLTVKGTSPLTVRTRLTNQELQTPNSTDVTYYEGTVSVTNAQGAPAGEGYLEMTGYAKSLTTP